MQTTLSTEAETTVDLYTKMQQQQNMYVPAATASNTGSVRSGQQNATVYRGPPGTTGAPPPPRNSGARPIPMPTMYPQMQQSVVLPTYPPHFAPRQQTFQHQQYQYTQPFQTSFYPYQYFTAMSQPPTHQRATVNVNAGVGVGINVGNGLSVQGGPSGPLTVPPGSTQSQMPLPGQVISGAVPGGSNAVLGVTANTATSNQVGVSPLLSVLPTGVPNQPAVAQSTGRRRKHALDIIDPNTNRNIWEDIVAPKSSSSADNEFSESIANTVPLAVQPDICAGSQGQDLNLIGVNNSMIVIANDQKTMLPYNMVPTTQGQTCITDADAVIEPKARSKKIPIVSPKDHEIMQTENLQINKDTLVKKEEEKYIDKSHIENSTTIAEAAIPQMLQEFSVTNAPILQMESSTEILKNDINRNNVNIENNLNATLETATNAVFAADAPNASNAEIENYETTKTQTNDEHLEVDQSSSLQPVQQSIEPATISEQTQPQLQAKISASNAAQTEQLETQQLNLKDGTADSFEQTAEVVAGVATNDETDRVIAASNDTIPTTTSDEISTLKAVDAVNSILDNAATTDTTESETETAIANATLETNAISDITAAVQASTIINYNEGQWSPNNPKGKKQYDRNQLLLLREAKASRIQPEVKNAAILPTTNLMPSFMRSKDKRVQSTGGSMIGGSGGNRGGGSGGSDVGGGIFKNTSMTGVNSRNSTKREMIVLNLSLNQDVKLNETDNAWRPRMLGKSKEAIESDDEAQPKREKEELVRRVRGILNKLTPEKFDKLVEEIIKLKIDTPDKMEDVMVLVFEKAIDEPNFSVSYARLCHRLVSEVKAHDERMESGTKTNLSKFRNALLDKTEREFTQNVTQPTAKEEKLKPIIDKIKKCNDQNEKVELKAMLEEEERKIRRRSTGTVRFIGELFKISMLTGKIINSCIDALLKYKSEDMLECLCKLLTTVGAKYEQTVTSNKETKTYYSLENQIAKMQAIASKTDKDGAKISSRVRFMLQDVIDMRKNGWKSSRNEVPKTMDQIEKETKNEQLSAQYLNYSSATANSGSGGGGGGGGSTIGGSGTNMSSQSGGNAGKQNDRMSRYGDGGRSSSNYSGSNSQRGSGGGVGGGGGDTGSLRRQKQGGDRGSSGGGGGSGGGGSTNANNNHSNGAINDENAWQVQVGRGSRYWTVDANKLEGMQQNLDMGTKKMGNMSQFVWNNNARQQQQQQQSSVAATSTPSNSFAALSLLADANKNIDRDRDRSGPRGKGGVGGSNTYNKGSMERDRYGDRGVGSHSRVGSSHASRENSSSRSGGAQTRGPLPTAMQKSASQSKYSQNMQQVSRISSSKSSVGVISSSSTSATTNSYANTSLQNVPSDIAAKSTVSAVAAAAATATPVVFEEPSEDDIKMIRLVITDLIEQVASSKTIDASIVSIMERINANKRCAFLSVILNNYLHLRQVGPIQRRQLANIVIYLINKKYLSVENFRLAYDNFCKLASDLIYDIPDLWLYIFEFTGPLVVKQIITIDDLWTNKLKEESSSNVAQKFLKSYLLYCTREVGPCFTRNMWKKFNMKWTDFMKPEEVNNFIETNHFQFIEYESATPKIEIKESKEKHVSRVVEHIETLLREGASTDGIIDYINGNIADVDKLFIRSLTTTLCNYAIIFNDSKLNVDKFQKVCIPILHRYIDSREERDLECLYAMQLLSHRLEHPRGLLTEMFAELYDSDVVPQESFLKWRDSKDQSAGKGVAVKGLNQFFNHLQSSDTSDDNN